MKRKTTLQNPCDVDYCGYSSFRSFICSRRLEPAAVGFAQTMPQRVPRPLNRPSARRRPERGAEEGSGARPAPIKREGDRQIDRLEKMSPAERRAVLDSLPTDRRERLEKRLDRLQKLSPEQRAQLDERLKRFKNLPSGQQQQVRQIARQLQQLPPGRKQAVRHELDTLRSLPEGERQSRLQSSTWKKQFSPQEQEILKQSTELLPQQP